MQKRFEGNPDLSPVDCLKKLGWKNDCKGENLAIVTSFLKMKEFKYKFKDKDIEYIPN